MPIRPDRFRVAPKTDVDLADWPTEIDPLYETNADYEAQIRENIDQLSELQDRFYADDRYAMLVIFQAMDAAGKDSAIKHVMTGVNPQGCQVTSFKHPSAHELDHDFLWRTNQHLPERGMIGIFNRSYYEEVLIVRVHPELLRAQNLPPKLLNMKEIWKDRFRSIVDLEDHLVRSGTKILKFFLHLSKGEQAKRFKKRIDNADKNWKFNVGDMREREFWGDYMRAYEDCLSSTSTKRAPWYVVPADDKKNARLIISTILVDAMQALDLRYPVPTKAQRAELAKVRKLL